MTITLTRNALLKPLQAISGIIDKKQTQLILSNVLLETKEDRLYLTGTDLEMSLVSEASLLSAEEPLRATVSARKLFEICRLLPEEAVLSLTLSKNNLVVKADDSAFTLKTLPTEEFPQLDAPSYTTTFSIPEAALKTLFSKTYFSMGDQDVRQYLNGTLLDIKQGGMHVVAMDGHRLAVASLTHDAFHGVTAQILLPRKSVLELMRLLESDTPDTITIGFNEKHVEVRANHFVFTSKLINARYPAYERIIPKGETMLLLERNLMKQALTRAAILSNEKFRGVRLKVEANRLLVSANNALEERVQEVVPLANESTEVEIGFNVSYLLDALSTLTSHMIRFIFTNADGGVLVRSDLDEPHLYVVMPMRL